MKIDAHQHFWQYDPLRDGWITEDMQVLAKDFMPDNLRSLLLENGIDGCVAVQADQSLEETELLLGLSDHHAWIKGVVGWVDLKGKDLSEQLNHFKQHKSFKGVRHILQAEAEGFMTTSEFIDGVSEVGREGLTYDILVNERQLEEVLAMVRQLPEMRLVIDHISKPDIKSKSYDHWAKCMKQLSEYEHLSLKLSGMITEADWQQWETNDLTPYIDFSLEHFGPSRLMYGSDWPVCLLAGSYREVIQSLKMCIRELSLDEQEKIMGGTAVEFYDLS